MTFFVALGKQLKNHEKPDKEKKADLREQVAQTTDPKKNASLPSG